MAEKLKIKGGKALQGEVAISGAKNAAVAIIPATIPPMTTTSPGKARLQLVWFWALFPSFAGLQAIPR